MNLLSSELKMVCEEQKDPKNPHAGWHIGNVLEIDANTVLLFEFEGFGVY